MLNVCSIFALMKRSRYVINSYGLFTLPNSDSDPNSNSDSKPNANYRNGIEILVGLLQCK